MTAVTERTEPTRTDTDDVDKPIVITRRRLDHFLVGTGILVTVVLAVAGGLLTWGSNFAEDYVSDELAAQNITFPPTEALEEEGRDDLAELGGELVDTGDEAEAYADYIRGHIEGIADGATYADLGDVQRGLEADLVTAQEEGAPDAEVAGLQEELDAVNGQRDSIFRGEMLRGTLLNTFAWSTIGRIAGIAAWAAFAGAVVMAVLVVLGLGHIRRIKKQDATAT